MEGEVQHVENRILSPHLDQKQLLLELKDMFQRFDLCCGDGFEQEGVLPVSWLHQGLSVSLPEVHQVGQEILQEFFVHTLLLQHRLQAVQQPLLSHVLYLWHQQLHEIKLPVYDS